MNNKQMMTGVNLSVKIGIGCGQCALLYVGGVFNRAELFTVGSALTLALKSEECAAGGGEIIVSESAFKYVTEYFTGAEINHDDLKFYRINGTKGNGIKTRADTSILRML